VTKYNTLEFANKVIDRLEQRQQILSAFAVASGEELKGTVSELAPTNPACNVAKPSAFFMCTTHLFSCVGTIVQTSFNCSVAPDSHFDCKFAYIPDCDNQKAQHVCNGQKAFSNPCNNQSPPKIFECGSFECNVIKDFEDAGFSCKDGYGCNALKFDCIAKKFLCSDNNNFNCMGKHECKKDFDCGSNDSKFACLGETKSDNFTCRHDFECAENKVMCIKGRYSCKKSVACNQSGTPYTLQDPSGA